VIEEAIFGYYFPLVDNIVPDQDSSSSILKVILQGFDHSKVENRRKLQFYSTSAVEDGAGAKEVDLKQAVNQRIHSTYY
jgi:hypothetical protein